MARVIDNRQISETTWEMTVEEPRMARLAKAGQFLIVRAVEGGERVPFTFSDWNADEGWIRFCYMVVGDTTRLLSGIEPSDELPDITGPLGNPSAVEAGRWAICCGGVGAAVCYPVARALCDAGAEVTVILAARSKNLFILRDEFEALPLHELLIVTDDGSDGEKALITVPLERLYRADAVDHTFAAGPIPMMRACAGVADACDKQITVSLNPIMVDGAGMCGACRCTVEGKTKFACIDGPDFDGRKVDWPTIANRLKFGSKQTVPFAEAQRERDEAAQKAARDAAAAGRAAQDAAAAGQAAQADGAAKSSSSSKEGGR